MQSPLEKFQKSLPPALIWKITRKIRAPEEEILSHLGDCEKDQSSGGRDLIIYRRDE